MIPVVGNPLADLLQSDMQVLVNLGYGSITDGWSQGPANVPTPSELFPTDLNWSDVLTALVNGVPQGIQAAIADLENPDNYQIPSLLDNPTLSTLVDAAYTSGLIDTLPIHHTQKNMLRERNSLHPIMEKVMAIHIAEEARHISFADQFLSKRVPQMVRRRRFVLSLHVPIAMRLLCQAIVVPTGSFFKHFDIPRSVRKELFFKAPDSRQALRDMYGDVRMLCDDVGLMNPLALLVWRICKINGQPSRYRGEPQRAPLPSRATAA